MGAGYEGAFVKAIEVARESRIVGFPKADSLAVAYAAIALAFPGSDENMDTAKCAVVAAYAEPLTDPAILPKHSSLTRVKYESAPAGVKYTPVYQGPSKAWQDAQSPKYQLFCLMMIEELGGLTGGQGVAWYAMSWAGRPTHWRFEVSGPSITVSRGREVV